MISNSIKSAILDERVGILVKTTLVDFPSRVACSIFLQGCNIRCPYCYNKGLVVKEEYEKAENLQTVQDIFEHLERRKNVLSGFTISGGEALCNKVTPYLIEYAKSIGYKVKLDTNGTYPTLLAEIIQNKSTKPDFIAMDIKTSPDRYCELSLGNKDFSEELYKSIQIISKYSFDCREWRTVLVPPLVKKDDILQIAKLLPKDASWQFAQFINENCIDDSYNKISPYSILEAKSLVNYAKTFIPAATLR